MKHLESQTGLGKRKKAAWIFTPIGALFLILTLSIGNDPIFGSTFRLMGLGVAGFMLVGGLHGLLSKPVLTRDEQGLHMTGWLLPQSNFELPWGQLQKARLMTGIQGMDVLWLWDAGNKMRVLEEWRWESFDKLLEHVKGNLSERKLELETVAHPSPQRKGAA